jgi:hypothetical protein
MPELPPAGPAQKSRMIAALLPGEVIAGPQRNRSTVRASTSVILSGTLFVEPA